MRKNLQKTSKKVTQKFGRSENFCIFTPAKQRNKETMTTMTTITKTFANDKDAIKFLDRLYTSYKFVTVIQAPINGGEYKFNVGN